MKKSERVYRELLYRAFEQKMYEGTQLELSKLLCVSLSTVHAVLAKLAALGAVKLYPMKFSMVDVKKILYLWASERRLEKDVTYATRVEMPVREIERAMPAGIVYAAYSAYKLRFHDVPADYSEVYVYADGEALKEIQKRFPLSQGKANLFVLQSDELLSRYGASGTLAQLFVDLWNLRAWYTSEFLQALEKRLNLPGGVGR